MRYLIRILNRLNLLRYINILVRVNVNGQSFRIPLLNAIGYAHLFPNEIWMQQLLARLLQLREDRTFVDVGVNVGQTMLVYRSITSTGDYIGFEPNPVCVHYVRELLRVNFFQGEVTPCAIGSFDGIGVLYADTRDDSAATMIKGFRENSGRVATSVPVISEKSLLSLLGNKVGIIKIDVEGSELEVLKALSSIIVRDQPFVICEILPVYHQNNHFRIQRQRELLAILESWNFKIFRIKPDGQLSLLRTIHVHSNLEECNYLFVPQEFQSTFINA